MNNKFDASGLNIWQLLALIAIGCLAYVSSYIVTFIWIVVFVASLVAVIKNKPEWIWYGLASSPILEVWSRMTSAPGIVDEIGKYYLLFTIPLIIYYQSKVEKYDSLYKVGVLLIACIAPSLLVNVLDFDREQWVFNVLSIIEAGVLLILLSRERWNIERFAKTIQVGLMPIIPLLTYLTIKSPTTGGIDFTVGANFAAAGGWGTNQVATVLGLAIVFATILLIIKRPLFTIKWISYVLIAYLFFRSFLTFSRGGVVSAVCSISIAFFYAMLSNRQAFVKYTFVLITIGVVGSLIFVEVNDVLGNKLLQRYLGETPGTLSGSTEKTWSKVTSGRSVMIEADLEIFSEYPVFGVGPGGAKPLRFEYGGPKNAAAHTEYSRLLSEHGLGGLIASLLLFSFPIYWMSRQRYKLWKGISGALFCMALLSAAHSAMRTNTTVVCYVLAATPIFIRRTKD